MSGSQVRTKHPFFLVELEVKSQELEVHENK
jgi:hypothetical protein